MGTYVWLGVAAAMGALEAATLTLVTIWFVIGALAAFVAGYFGATLAWQVVVFGVVSLIALVLFRPLALKHRARGQQAEATPVGQAAVVVEDVDPASLSGRVRTPDGVTWAAMSKDGLPIQAGTSVRVTEAVSIKLVVERM